MMSSLRERLERIKPLIETTSKIKSMIAFGTLTGSHAFGVSTEASDIDILISPDIHLEMGDIVNNHNGIYLHGNEYELDLHYWGEGFKTCYVLSDGKIYNLILCSSGLAYAKWLHATLRMIRHSREDFFRKKIKDKETRVEYFERFKEGYKP